MDTAGACPGLEDLATLLDGSLDSVERDRLLAHLASCRDCRETFLATRSWEEGASHGAPRRFLFPSALAAAAVLVVAVTFTFKQTPTQPARMAASSPPAALPPIEKDQPRVALQNGAGTSAPQPKPSGNGSATPNVSPATRQQGAALALLSPEEAAQPAEKSFGFAGNLASEGPYISVPEEAEALAQQEFKLAIDFAPKDGSEVLPSTVKLECLKENPIDLTERVLPYASKEGLLIDKVALPPGLYRFRVSIGDVKGRMSEKDFTIKVTVKF